MKNEYFVSGLSIVERGDCFLSEADLLESTNETNKVKNIQKTKNCGHLFFFSQEI